MLILGLVGLLLFLSGLLVAAVRRRSVWQTFALTLLGATALAAWWLSEVDRDLSGVSIVVRIAGIVFGATIMFATARLALKPEAAEPTDWTKEWKGIVIAIVGVVVIVTAVTLLRSYAP